MEGQSDTGCTCKKQNKTKKPSNISQLKQICIEECGKISSDPFQRLVDGYTEVISAEEDYLNAFESFPSLEYAILLSFV